MRTAASILLATLAQAAELHQAVRTCDVPRIQQLLAKQPNLNELDDSGQTPLLIAIDARKPECVGLLISAGADRNTPDPKGRTPLNALMQVSNTQDRAALAARYFPQRSLSATQQATPWTLEHSIPRGQTEVTKMLLQMGADPNRPSTNGSTPLAAASFKGDLEAVRILLAHGAKPDIPTKAGTQPIHEAALGDSAPVIQELAAKGASINARTRDEQQTPLHLAASMGKLKAIQALLALHADATLKDTAGRTPLEAAQRAGLTDAAALLHLR